MTERVCEHWHELIAMDVFGDLSFDETTGLRAHLEGCVECRSVAHDVATTFSLLRYVDPATVEPTASVPIELTNKVLGDLRRAARAQRRRLRVRVAGGGVLGAVAAAVILAIVFSGRATPTRPLERTLALRGTAAAVASAVMSERSWGTSLDLRERGLPGGEVYTVSMETARGTWWTAGTYRSVGGKTVNATMACAVSLKQITGVRVVNASGVTVLSSYASATSLSYG
ncbi:MAG: zf-HC2 domain-containing protein [Acidimicrobiales bacterium]